MKCASEMVRYVGREIQTLCPVPVMSHLVLVTKGTVKSKTNITSLLVASPSRTWHLAQSHF